MSIYSGIFPLNIVIFHSYISLPEGTQYPIALRIVTVFLHWDAGIHKKKPSQSPTARNPIGDGL